MRKLRLQGTRIHSGKRGQDRSSEERPASEIFTIPGQGRLLKHDLFRAVEAHWCHGVVGPVARWTDVRPRPCREPPFHNDFSASPQCGTCVDPMAFVDSTACVDPMACGDPMGCDLQPGLQQ